MLSKKELATLASDQEKENPAEKKTVIQIQAPSKNWNELKEFPSQLSILLDLARELLDFISLIFANLDQRDLALVGTLCRLFYSVSRDPIVQANAAETKRNYCIPQPQRDFQLTMRGNESPSAQFCLVSLSDNLIISSSQNRKITVWNLKTRECEQVFSVISGHTTFVAKLSASKIVSGCSDNSRNEIRVWDINSGECIQTLPTGGLEPRCGLVLSPDELISGFNCFSSMLNPASLATMGNLRLWNLKTGESEILEGHTQTVCCLLRLADGTVLSGSDDKTIRVWDWQKRVCLETLSGNKNAVRSISELPDGRIVSVDEFNIYVWNRQNPQHPRIIAAHFGWDDLIKKMVYLSGNRVLCITSQMLCIWDIDLGQCLRQYKTGIYLSGDVALTENGRLAVSTLNGQIHIRDFAFLDSRPSTKEESKSNFTQKSNFFKEAKQQRESQSALYIDDCDISAKLFQDIYCKESEHESEYISLKGFS